MKKITTKAKLASVVGHNRRLLMYQMPIKIKNTYTGYKDPYKKFDEICEKHNIKPRANAVLATSFY